MFVRILVTRPILTVLRLAASGYTSRISEEKILLDNGIDRHAR